jgi:hypothetical protein
MIPLVHGGNARKLFHGVVVMGAALGAGCGMSKPDEPSSTAGSSGDGGTSALAGGGGAAGSAQSGSGGGAAVGTGGTDVINICNDGSVGCTQPGGGTPMNPLGPSDCAMPQQFIPAYQCGGANTASRCDTTAPLTPSDCAHTYQFVCADWSSNCGCRCDSTAPGDVSVCTAGRSPMLLCYSYDPPVGCSCVYLAPAIL